MEKASESCVDGGDQYRCVAQCVFYTGWSKVRRPTSIWLVISHNNCKSVPVMHYLELVRLSLFKIVGTITKHIFFSLSSLTVHLYENIAVCPGPTHVSCPHRDFVRYACNQHKIAICPATPLCDFSWTSRRSFIFFSSKDYVQRHS